MKPTPLVIAFCFLASGSVAWGQPLRRTPVSPLQSLRAIIAEARETPPRLSFAEMRPQPQPTVPASLPIPVVPQDQELPINSDAAKMFAQRIQPVLGNLCSSCHVKADTAGAFRLKPIPEGYADPQVTAANLATVARFVNRQNPALSPLLTKAVLAHGKAKEAPMFSRQHPAFRNLEIWAYWIGLPEGSPLPNPAVPQVAVIPRTSIPIPPPQPDPTRLQLASATTPLEPVSPTPATLNLKPMGQPAPAPGVVHLAQTGTAQPQGSEFGTASKPAPSPAVLDPEDPYDPGVFNRLAHPNRR